MNIPAMLMACLSLQAQTTADTLAPAAFRDYQFVKRTDPWLTNRNAAGLARFASTNIGEAELSVSKGNGGLVDYYQSEDDLQADARIESFYRLSPRTVAFGGMSYNNFAGRQMAGSAFIDPTRLPFDIVEDSLTNPGRKHRDTYSLTGALAFSLVRDIAAGIRLDYTAANYAKYRDLRHQNRLMDLTLTAGMTVPLGRHATLGANYLYRRAVESVNFDTYGTNDKVFKSLVSYAAFMGKLEQFGGPGFTDDSREMPLFDERHGVALQAEGRFSPNLSLFNVFSYTTRSGYYGRKSPYTITYTEHNGHQMADQARLSYRSGRSRHSLDFGFAFEKLENNRNNYRELQNEAGASYYEYYDPVKAADKQWTQLNATYTADLGICGELPAWTITVGTNWQQRQQTAQEYPFFRRQKLTRQAYFAGATRQLPCQKGLWALSLHGTLTTGSGTPFEDGAYTTPGDKQQAPPAMQAWLWREYDFLTATQVAAEVSAKYTFLFPGTQLGTFVRATVGYRRATGEVSEYNNGKDHTLLTFAIGCNL